jgi:hypothetical protein
MATKQTGADFCPSWVASVKPHCSAQQWVVALLPLLVAIRSKAHCSVV